MVFWREQKFGNLKNEILGRVGNWELKTWVSSLRFNAYFNVSFNLFLSNCWLLVFGFQQDSAVKPEVLKFFLT